MSNKEGTTTVSDEVVIEALLNDAKKFKSKWELNVNEPTRSRPNTRFLQRTLKNVMSVNERQPSSIADDKKSHRKRSEERSCKRSQSSDKYKSKSDRSRGKRKHSRSRSRSPKKQERHSRKD